MGKQEHVTQSGAAAGMRGQQRRAVLLQQLCCFVNSLAAWLFGVCIWAATPQLCSMSNTGVRVDAVPAQCAH